MSEISTILIKFQQALLIIHTGTISGNYPTSLRPKYLFIIRSVKINLFVHNLYFFIIFYYIYVYIYYIYVRVAQKNTFVLDPFELMPNGLFGLDRGTFKISAL